MKWIASLRAFAFLLTVANHPICYAQNELEAVGSYEAGKLMIISANLNDQLVTCVVDTGASHHMIDSSLKSALGRCWPYPKDKNIEICGPQNLVVGGLNDSVRTGSAVVDLSPIRTASGMDFDMVIGRPFLMGKVLEINHEERQFRISTNANETDADDLELHLDQDGRPCVTVAIADQEVMAMLDTGTNADLTLKASLFDQLEISGSWPCNGEAVKSEVVSIGGRASAKKIESCSVRIGRYTMESCTIATGEQNMIGFGLLCRFVATIDLKNMRLRLSLPTEPCPARNH